MTLPLWAVIRGLGSRPLACFFVAPAIVCFSGTLRCGSKCEAFVGQYEEIAKNSVGMQDVVVAKVNADYAADLVPRFEVYNYPAVLFFKKGATEVTKQFLTKLVAAAIAETLHRAQKEEL